MYFREIALPRGVGRRIVTRHQQILNLVRLWHDVWIKVVFLPCYSRTKLQLSSARQKHDVWTGPKKRYYISRWNYIALCVESLVRLSVDDITFCVDINYISGHKDRKGTLERIECFHSRGQHLCKFIGTKGSVCITNEFNSHRIHWELVWDTNMAAVSLFWDTNMVAVTSCENTL